MTALIHDAIVVTAGAADEVARARTKAIELGLVVTDIQRSKINNWHTFLICPDGSKEGKPEDEAGEAARAAWTEWARGEWVTASNPPFTGGACLRLVHVRYGELLERAAIVDRVVDDDDVPAQVGAARNRAPVGGREGAAPRMDPGPDRAGVRDRRGLEQEHGAAREVAVTRLAHLPNGTRIEVGLAQVETTLPSGAIVPAVGRPDQLETARELGYGYDIDALTRDHDPLHSLLAHWLGLPASFSLRQAAGELDTAEFGLAALEEQAVLAIHAFARAAGVVIAELEPFGSSE